MTDLGIGLVHVITAEEADIMRVIRNTCRDFMTGYQKEISFEEQQQWFDSIRGSTTVQAFLFGPRPFQRRAIEAFGFGVVRRRDAWPTEQWVVSGGLRPEYRGKGYGVELFGQLTTLVHGLLQPCWLDVFEDNVSALLVYKKLGFEVVATMIDGAPGSRVVLTMRKDPP